MEGSGLGVTNLTREIVIAKNPKLVQRQQLISTTRAHQKDAMTWPGTYGR